MPGFAGVDLPGWCRAGTFLLPRCWNRLRIRGGGAGRWRPGGRAAPARRSGSWLVLPAIVLLSKSRKVIAFYRHKDTPFPNDKQSPEGTCLGLFWSTNQSLSILQRLLTENTRSLRNGCGHSCLRLALILRIIIATTNVVIIFISAHNFQKFFQNFSSSLPSRPFPPPVPFSS